MTALVAIEHSDLSETVTFSEKAVRDNEGDSSHISRDVGEKMTMEECLYGMMLESANECAYAVAEHVGGGSAKPFVKLMNEKAAELGCTNTHFNNPNGLPDKNHKISARDMAIISRAAFANKSFRTICTTKTYSIPPTNKHSDPTPLNNHHRMLHNYKGDQYIYEGCLGGKTGYTDAAGHTLVTYAKRKGMTLICVVLNGPADGYYQDTIKLFDHCFSEFTPYAVKDTDALKSSTNKAAGELFESNELFTVDEDATVVLPKTASPDDVDIIVEPADGKVTVTEDGENGETTRELPVIGKMSFSYEDHFVGSGSLLFTGSEGYHYPFHNLKGTDVSSQEQFFTVDFLLVGQLIAALAGLVLFVFFLRWMSGVMWQRKIRRRTKREEQKRRYTSIRNNGRRNKRRR